jgi:hypothetical protein
LKTHVNLLFDTLCCKDIWKQVNRIQWCPLNNYLMRILSKYFRKKIKKFILNHWKEYYYAKVYFEKFPKVSHFHISLSHLISYWLFKSISYNLVRGMLKAKSTSWWTKSTSWDGYTFLVIIDHISWFIIY